MAITHPQPHPQKGEFEEFHDLNTIVEIGSIIYDTENKKVIDLVDKQKIKEEVSPITTAMSVDPLCEKYYWISPYAFCLNNPVRFIDPDGREVRRLTKEDAARVKHLVQYQLML